MAQAVLRLWPGTEYSIGPTIENGFYYDFLFAEPITDADLARIEEEMARIVAEDLPSPLRGPGRRGAGRVRRRRGRPHR